MTGFWRSLVSVFNTLAASTGAGRIGADDGASGLRWGNLQDFVGQAAAGDAAYKIRPIFGVIRQDTSGAGWYLLNDAGHQPNGLASVSVNGSGELVVSYSFVSDKVGALCVTPDEIYANLGIWCGASVGGASATVQLFKDLYGTVNMGSLALSSDTYFSGKLSAVLNADGSVTVTHPNCGSATVGVSAGETQGYENRVQSYTANTITFASWVEFSGYIEYNGVGWSVTTQAKEKPTVLFSSGVLTVTHEVLPTQDAYVTVDGRDVAGGTNSVHARPGASTTSQFEVVFRDNSGAMVTVESTSMRFYYNSVSMVKREVPVGVVNFTRPGCKLDANQVFSAAGNFWISGVMKP